VNDYAPGLLSARDHLRYAEQQAALGHFTKALDHLCYAQAGIATMYESFLELQERQREQKGS
jgi:hypothetical protein